MKYLLTASLLLFCLISFSQTKHGVHKKKPKNTYAIDAAGGWDADSATGGWVADSTLRKYTAGKDTAIWPPAPKNMQTLCVGWDTSKMHRVGVNTILDTIFGGWTMDTADNIYKPSPLGQSIWDQVDTSAQYKTWPLQMPLQYQIGNGPMNEAVTSDDLQMMTTAIMLKILENLVEQVHTLEKQVKALQRKNVPRHHKPKGISKKITIWNQ